MRRGVNKQKCESRLLKVRAVVFNFACAARCGKLAHAIRKVCGLPEEAPNLSVAHIIISRLVVQVEPSLAAHKKKIRPSFKQEKVVVITHRVHNNTKSESPKHASNNKSENSEPQCKPVSRSLLGLD